MKFDILHDYNKFISHIVLHDPALVTEISNTKAWKNNRETVAKITINGVEVPFEKIEEYFRNLAKSMQEAANEKYSDVEKEVQSRLEERLEEEVEPILQRLREVNEVLSSSGDLLKPYWDRN